MRENHVCNSEQAKEKFKSLVDELFDEHRFVTFEWRIGADRSLSQNALFHVWVAEYAAHILGVSKKQVGEELMDGMKRTLKRTCYSCQGYEFLIYRIPNMFGRDVKRDFRSSAKYDRGEMFMFLNWVQQYAAEQHGLILESSGEYAKLKREQFV